MLLIHGIMVLEVINMIIYKITNNINGKVYVGQTVRTLEERRAEHKRHAKIVVGKAIRKYGIENFTFVVVEEASSIEELNELEIKWIAHYNCIIPNGYNQCYGGENTVGFNHRNESKKKMSEKKTQQYQGDGNPFFGKTHSDEQKAKWSKERKGRDLSKATQASLESVRRKVVNLDTGELFDSVREAASNYNLKETHVSRVCRGGRKTTGGFRWQYQ